MIIMYNPTNPSKEVRRRLDDLCVGENYPFDDPVKYKAVFFPEFDGELIVESPPPSRENQYNCFGYALGLTTWVRTTVMAQALGNHDLKPTDNPQAGDMVIYHNNVIPNVKHAGRYFSATEIISKWAGSPIFRHETFLCPLQYGDRIDFYKAVSKEFAEGLIAKYPIPNE